MARLDPYDPGGAPNAPHRVAAMPLPKFIWRTLLLLAPCFAGWFFIAPYHAAVLAPLSLPLVEPWRVGLVTAVERTGATLTFVTGIEAGSSGGRIADLIVEVNPMIYSYGLALFVALMLGSRARGWKIVAGAAALLPFQAWGIAFDFLVQVAVLSGPEVTARAGLSGWPREAIAIGYQAGTLVFPSLVPVLCWALFNRAFIAGLRPKAAEAERVLARELRPEEKDLRGVIHPQQ
jgi:hypothetical protein